MMGHDPNKWTKYAELSDPARKRMETLYPYLKPDSGLFLEKKAGVFIKYLNTGKVEKLLETQRPNQKTASSGPRTVKAASAG
ncbi:MAG: hypothetical protein OEV94_02675 [Deltaproteobacteria bacterium]|nr:hypothetical protein [Deltaproteobacteria bacterium]